MKAAIILICILCSPVIVLVFLIIMSMIPFILNKFLFADTFMCLDSHQDYNLTYFNQKIIDQYGYLEQDKSSFSQVKSTTSVDISVNTLYNQKKRGLFTNSESFMYFWSPTDKEALQCMDMNSCGEIRWNRDSGECYASVLKLND
jgi:hypothetical protein